MAHLDTGLADALATQDVDALRRLLAERSQPPPPPPETSDGNFLADRAVQIADDLLALGLPHLERVAAADAAEPDGVDGWPTLRIEELGLTLRAQPVMGHPVWPAALALGRWLRSAHGTGLVAGKRVLELGAGGGAPGLVARAAGASHLTLSEGDDSLLPLMAANIEANPQQADGATWTVRALDWRDTAAVEQLAGGDGDGGSGSGESSSIGRYDVLLAADVLYGAGDIQPLVRACACLLAVRPSSRLLLARSAWFEELQPTLVASAEEAGLTLLGSSVPTPLPPQESTGAAEGGGGGGGRGGAPQSSDAVVEAECEATVLEFGFRV